MAGSLNKVQLIGRLGADPEIKQMVNGKNVARLSIATSQSWKDKSSGERKEKLLKFIEHHIDHYKKGRDHPAERSARQ